jgi:hypothetical protein
VIEGRNKGIDQIGQKFFEIGLRSHDLAMQRCYYDSAESCIPYLHDYFRQQTSVNIDCFGTIFSISSAIYCSGERSENVAAGCSTSPQGSGRFDSDDFEDESSFACFAYFLVCFYTGFSCALVVDRSSMVIYDLLVPGLNGKCSTNVAFSAKLRLDLS